MHFNNVTILRDTLVAVTTKCIKCPICSEQLSGLDKFTIHLFTHRDVSPPIIEEEKSKTLLDKDNEQCSSINKTNQNDLESALKLNLSPNVYNSTATTQTNVRCEICNISFSDSNILDMHKKLLHTNGFSCHLCHKRFKMQGSLMVHMRVAHYGFGHMVDTDNGMLKG